MNDVREIALAAGAAVLFAVALVVALEWEAAAATFPAAIAVTGLGLSLWAVVADILNRRHHRTTEADLSEDDRTRARGAFIWIAVFFASVLLIGFEWGVGIAALAFYRFEARLGWVSAVLASAACGGFLYVAAHFLSIPLYDGWLLDLIP